jgi:hypothetical protein
MNNYSPWGYISRRCSLEELTVPGEWLQLIFRLATLR